MRRFLKITGLLALGFVAGLLIGIAGGGSGQTTATLSVPAAAPTAFPAASSSPSPKPAPFKPRTVLSFTGTGQEATPRFDVGGSGDYTVSWTFSRNIDPDAGIASNFIIEEEGGSGDFEGPNVVQESGTGSTDVSGDTGTHAFNVQAAGDWTVKVVTAP